MKKIFIGIFIILIASCTKEQNTNYTATFINNTNHNITILCYKNGIVQTSDTLRIAPNQKLQFANGTDRGLKTGPGFSSKHFGSSDDSSFVIFDNQYRVAHYTNPPLKLASKYYLYSSIRNMGNINSYKFEIIKVSKRSNKIIHEYTFTEDDYLYAK